MSNKRKGLWEESITLWCSRCRKAINKFSGTKEIENNIYCGSCENWLCGSQDAFGYKGEE